MHEPKVCNDMDEVTQGREARWRDIQERQAHWTTRGGWMENSKGSRQDVIAHVIVVGVFFAGIAAFIIFIATMAR